MAAPSWCAKYIGIPYSDRGRGDDAVDCWGLAQRVLREQFGVIVPDYAEYYSTRRDAVRVGGRITSEISAGWTEIDKGAQVAGDCILLISLGQPIHVGVVVDGQWMLHIEQGTDACMEKYSSGRWVNKIKGFFRYDA